MTANTAHPDFWDNLTRLVRESRVVIDRPRHSRHPRLPKLVYPLDYGYLEGTRSGDGEGIDVWLGSGDRTVVTGVACTVDLYKRDAELKVLLGCSEAERQTIFHFLNDPDSLNCLVLARPGQEAT